MFVRTSALFTFLLVSALSLLFSFPFHLLVPSTTATPVAYSDIPADIQQQLPELALYYGEGCPCTLPPPEFKGCETKYCCGVAKQREDVNCETHTYRPCINACNSMYIPHSPQWDDCMMLCGQEYLCCLECNWYWYDECLENLD